MTISTGKYQHYKGACYQVLHVAKHSETEEEHVVYRTLYGDHSVWIRPLSMFIEDVNLDGNRVPRFKKVSE
ncbi:DUF1653 domain-containing protein [Thalassotalea mangrovi]|uniref:DUF1653 domain-containing protein n=1 Tax=Thalassotalea mangrovi TaxID=2572245 RepID=A0A4U1B421_9GAMM|nr:DUF1653 domain-containing protein [Thalassotalea mangrovi]TKB44757.1 DUF1653 domain-containing protein [Thalassotalea mangrovi]